MSALPRPRQISYGLFITAVLLTVWLNLGPVALAGLFSYMILDLVHRRLLQVLDETWARWLALASFIVIAASAAWLFWIFVKLTVDRTPVILNSLVPKIAELAAQYGVDLPFENLHDLRLVIIEELKVHVRGVTQASGLLTKGFFQIIVGIFTAALCFLAEGPEATPGTLFEALRLEFDDRMSLFTRSFSRIFGAQVLISFINTGVTSIYLLSSHMPYVHFLVLSTFVFGVIPVAGTVISNTMIVATALTISPRLAALTLIFLIVAHKIQYFLNSQIVGSSIDTPMWQVLLGLLVGEAVMGVPGMILAPALIHYARVELQAVPAGRRRQPEAEDADERASATLL